MIRLDPGDERIHTTRTFKVWEGGGEYNVERGLKRCFGKRAAVVTAIADNPVVWAVACTRAIRLGTEVDRRLGEVLSRSRVGGSQRWNGRAGYCRDH